MRLGINRSLANVKTRQETGLDFIMQNIDLNTPFGKKQLKEIKPYFPGEEDELREELDKVESMVHFVQENKRLVEQIQELFMELKEVTYSINRSATQTLAVVEIYEIKSLLLSMRRLLQLTVKGDTCLVPDEYILEDTKDSNELVMRELRSTFKPEFINRIDEIIPFSSLSDDTLSVIAEQMLKKLKEKSEKYCKNFDIVFSGDLLLLRCRAFRRISDSAPCRTGAYRAQI